MKLSDLIIKYYKSPYLQNIENKRKNLLFTLKIIMVVFVIAEFCVVYYLETDFEQTIELIVVGLGIYSLIYYFIRKIIKKNLKKMS
jgi:hypothetical protein